MPRSFTIKTSAGRIIPKRTYLLCAKPVTITWRGKLEGEAVIFPRFYHLRGRRESHEAPHLSGENLM